MKRIYFASFLVAITLLVVGLSQLYIYQSLTMMMEPIVMMENDVGDIRENAQKLITTYAERQRWLLLIVDNNVILPIGVSISIIDIEADPNDIYLHSRHAKAEIERSMSLLFAPF